ncbi:hypothetical protein ACJX0J_031114, partial [Zea mays]
VGTFMIEEDELLDLVQEHITFKKSWLEAIEATCDEMGNDEDDYLTKRIADLESTLSAQLEDKLDEMNVDELRNSNEQCYSGMFTKIGDFSSDENFAFDELNGGREI